MARWPFASSTREPSSKDHSSSETDRRGSAIGDPAPYSTSRSAFSASSTVCSFARPWTSLSSLPYRAATSFMVRIGSPESACATRGLSFSRFASSHAAEVSASSLGVIAWNAFQAANTGWNALRVSRR